MNILGKRYLFFAFSLIVIVPGLFLLFNGGMPLSIDFTGGSLLEIRFDSAQPQPADILAVYEDLGIKDAQAQTTSQGTYLIRSAFLDESVRSQVAARLTENIGPNTILRFDSVGPTVGKQVTQRGLLAVGIAALAVVIYITVVFNKIPHAFRYGICAIIAMVHDVAIALSVAGYGRAFFGWQVDVLFLTALLTVIGFSVQDKIVVFDRIRENSNVLRRLPFETLANHSIIQTLQRSINTQLMTVEFMLLALALFGGITLREFAVILLVGLLSGTYSSIFIAAPILVVWENQEWKRWFKRSDQQPA